MKRSDTLALTATTMAWPGLARAQRRPDGHRVLRLSFRVAETAVDPAQISGIHSRTVVQHTHGCDPAFEMIGYRRPLFWQDGWQYVDVLPGAHAAA